MKYAICKNDLIDIPRGSIVLFMSEIENSPGHCVFLFQHKIYHGYHTDNFYFFSGKHFFFENGSGFCITDFMSFNGNIEMPPHINLNEITEES